MARSPWTTKHIADLPLAAALAATLLLTVYLLWANTEARDRLDAEVVTLAETQNVLTGLATNLTAEIDDLVEGLTRLEGQRAALEQRRDAVAMGSAQLEYKRVLELREKAKKEMRRIHEVIDATKKELIEFINAKK